MTPQEILEQVKQKFGDAITEAEVKGVEVRLTAPPEKSWEVCRFLRDLGFEYLNCLSGADWLTRLEVVYDISSLQHSNKVHLRVPVGRQDPVVRTVTNIWRSADWHERECYDLFGVRFDAHPDHRRILLPEDWVGFPLRKDYTDERLVPYTEYGAEEKLPKAEPAKPAAKPAASAPAKPTTP
ncbi:MAG TPA: NADH-quinone oxidoreductase subunit C [Candidatus Methylomirabilis sp.]|nr:NADH-quinone oxidoreductase subunit C [Candidatus Methylomirabilis sp.]HSC70166.1 NADH-quinone oxidoreductase subunit C [Candidatus Methylomirabilis sp.]